MINLDEIEARLDAATPGPWRRGDYSSEPVLSGIWSDNGLVLVARTCFAPASDTNADLIANAPTDMRAMLDEVTRLRGLELDRDENLTRLQALGQECDHE